MKNLSYGPSQLNVPSYAGFQFGLANINGKEIDASGGFHTCREGLLSKISDSLNHLNTDKAHMLLKWEAGSTKALETKDLTKNDLDNQKWIETSLRLLHLYEKMAGWPLTKMYRVKTDNGDNTKLYYCISSRRWIKAPYLISLYILLVRIGRFKYLHGFKTEENLADIIGKLNNGKLGSNSSDEIYMRDTFQYWRTIVTKYADLFRKKKIEYYWSKERLTEDAYIGYEGIAYLSSGSTHNKTLHSKFMKLHKEKGKGEKL